MPRPLSALLIAATLAASADASANYPATSEDLRGMAALTCSGVIVRLGRDADRPAVLLTNGHCVRLRMIDPNDALVNVPYERNAIAVHAGGEKPLDVQATRVLYATMTGTDLALVELAVTYRELEARGARAYAIADAGAKPEASVVTVSGQWKEKQLCAVSHVVDRLDEDAWTFRDILALRDPCPIQGGWSGTPLLDPETSAIVGLVAKSNAAGGLCTLDNPCEILRGGERLAFHGRTYATQVAPILGCLDASGDLDLARAGCALPKPKPARDPKPAPSPSPTGKPDKSSGGSRWPKLSR